MAPPAHPPRRQDHGAPAPAVVVPAPGPVARPDPRRGLTGGPPPGPRDGATPFAPLQAHPEYPTVQKRGRAAGRFWLSVALVGGLFLLVGVFLFLYGLAGRGPVPTDLKYGELIQVLNVSRQGSHVALTK